MHEANAEINHSKEIINRARVITQGDDMNQTYETVTRWWMHETILQRWSLHTHEHMKWSCKGDGAKQFCEEDHMKSMCDSFEENVYINGTMITISFNDALWEMEKAIVWSLLGVRMIPINYVTMYTTIEEFGKVLQWMRSMWIQSIRLLIKNWTM